MITLGQTKGPQAWPWLTQLLAWRSAEQEAWQKPLDILQTLFKVHEFLCKTAGNNKDYLNSLYNNIMIYNKSTLKSFRKGP